MTAHIIAIIIIIILNIIFIIIIIVIILGELWAFLDSFQLIGGGLILQKGLWGGSFFC